MAKPASAQKSVRAPDADALARAAMAAARPRGLPPVHLWDPPFCGDLDMRIARDGMWFYLGTPIGRAPLVRLFSTILKREGERYFLVTPVEKVGITVDDAPFVAVDFRVAGEGAAQALTFLTNVGDEAAAGPDHPVRVRLDPATGEPAPYVLIRANLEALIDRKSFYRMIDLGSHAAREDVPPDAWGGEAGADGRWFGIWSGGVFFPIIPSADLPPV